MVPIKAQPEAVLQPMPEGDPSAESDTNGKILLGTSVLGVITSTGTTLQQMDIPTGPTKAVSSDILSGASNSVMSGLTRSVEAVGNCIQDAAHVVNDLVSL